MVAEIRREKSMTKNINSFPRIADHEKIVHSSLRTFAFFAALR
jgi:hypothetical protein